MGFDAPFHIKSEIKATLTRDSALASTMAAPYLADATPEPRRGWRKGRRKSKKVADLLCGAGGTSTGAKRALEMLGYKMELVALNHWPIAIETHRRNHPTARHYCQDVSVLRPLVAVPEGWLDLLLASPTCTHHSRARGGKPTSDQQRMDPWHVITWLTELRVRCLLIENVPEYVDWGPVDTRSGKPIKSRKGEYFRSWLNTLAGLGYKFEWRMVVFANYGDATTRTRFILLARNDGRPIIWANHTHSREGTPDHLGHGARKWRSAREIIDWTRPGRSLWGRPKDLAAKTIDRTFAGAQKFAWPAPYRLALARLLRQQLDRELGEAASILVDARSSAKQRDKANRTILYATKRLQKLDDEVTILRAAPAGGPGEPILVVLRGTEPSHISGGAKGIDEPLPTITANGYHMALATPTAEPVSLPGQGHPFVLGQQSCAAPRSVDDPVPTITTDGYIRLFTADAKPILVSVTGADKPKSVRSVDEPLATITTKNGTGLAEPVLVKLKGKSDAADIDQPAPTITTVQQLALAEPLIAPYYGGGSGETCNSVDEPLPTVTTKARFSLIEPAAEPFIVSPRHARPGAGPGPRSVNDPLPTITAGGSQVALVDSQVQPLSAVDFAHLEALSREDRLVMIDGTLHVIDVLFRMIFNDELARATGLDDYEFAGTSHDITKQIGNAVPVHGATALIHDFMSV